MSYNTRRTGGAPSGRSAPTTQVNYHQQPSRPAAGGNQTQARNAGYTSTPQSGYISSTQPAYTTQTGYSTTAPPLPKAAQTPQPQPPPAAAQPPPPPTTQPKQPPSTPVSLKQEPLTPADTPKMDTSENGDVTLSTKPTWKKKPYIKLPNKVRKARQNAKLRRILNPKNALTFLNELKPGLVKFVVREEPGWGYVASVDIDGKTYTGHALTVSKAKVQASEQALRNLLLEQLSKSQTAPPPAAEKEEDKEGKEDEPMDEDKGEDGETKPKKSKEQPEDELPWGSLAAFALHKLFAEWQKDGAEGPHGPPEKHYEDDGAEEAYFTRRPGPPPPDFGYPRRFGPGPYGRGRGGYAPYPPRAGGPLPPQGIIAPRRPPFAGGFPTSKPPLPTINPLIVAPMKKIPDDANKRHPVMLLNQLKPNVVYNESQEGQAPNVIFHISVEIEGKQYAGQGKSKKEAKKAAAKAALAPLGIHYEEDN